MPEALSNTLLIAERCNVDLSPKGYHLPLFTVPEGYTAESYLRELCEEGLQRRYGAHCCDADVRERLEYELGVIHEMGFDAYFLIVWDLCRYAREQGIWYNARGSAAGSMVAYTLDITLVEPLDHGLIFERFLNPGRISMPDIDLDFQDDRRAEMMEYCANSYGSDKVAQIITFGTLGARGAIRDVGRVMDIPLSEVDRVAKLIPKIPSKPVTIREALEQVPELKEIYDETEYLREADRYRRQDGRRGAQCRHACRRRGHHRPAAHRLCPAAPPHQRLGRSARSRPWPSSRCRSSNRSACSRSISWAGHADHHAARLRPDRAAPRHQARS